MTHGSAPFPSPHSSPFSSFSSSFKNLQQLGAWQHHRSPARGGDIAKAAAAGVGKFEKSLKTLQDSPPPPAPEAPTAQTGASAPRASGPGSCWSSSRSSPGKEKKNLSPSEKLPAAAPFPCPLGFPLRPQNPVSEFARCHLVWSGPPPSARRPSLAGPRTGLEKLGDREAPGAPNSAARLGRQAHLSPAPPPASRWGCSSSSPAWCLLPGLAPGFARSLVAGCGARRASWLTPSGRSQHARGCSAGLGRRGDSPTHGADAKRPAARLQVAGAPRGGSGGGWRPGPAARYAGRAGGAGGGCLQPRWRGVAARPGDPSRPVQDRRAPGGGRRRELRAGAASLRSSSSSPPSSPSSSLRRQQVGLGAAAAAQSSSGRAGPSCGLPGRLSPEPLPRDARKAGRARRGARAHTLHAPAAGLRGSPGPPGTEAGTPPRLRSPRPPLPGLPPQAGPAAQAVSAMTSMKQGAVSFPQVPPSRRSPPHPALPVAPSPKLRLAAPDSLTSPST